MYYKSDLYIIFHRFLLTNKFSQDHLENFFSVIRSRLGSNNNPSAFQLLHLMRKIMVGRVNVSFSSGTNCEPSFELSIPKLPCPKNMKDDEIALTEAYEDDVINLDNLNLSNYTNNIVVYIAGFVVKKLRKSLKCSLCISALVETSDTRPQFSEFLDLKNRGGLVVPSSDVSKICTWTERVVRHETQLQPIFGDPQLRKRLCIKTMNLIISENLFGGLSPHSS